MAYLFFIARIYLICGISTKFTYFIWAWFLFHILVKSLEFSLITYNTAIDYAIVNKQTNLRVNYQIIT